MSKIKYKVWGIGLGRTGTSSFCKSLEILGYSRVKHNPLFEELKDLDAAADNGCTIFYKYLDYKFPNSKFVLLTRDIDSWLKSMKFKVGLAPLSRDQDIAIMRRMTLYGTTHFERDKYIEAYHRHHEEVRSYFKDRKSDLLELNIPAGEGCDKLCPFLELKEPEEAFVLHNSSEQIRKNLQPKSLLKSLFRKE